MLKNQDAPGKGREDFQLLPYVDLQAVVMDLALAVEELRSELSQKTARLEELESRVMGLEAQLQTLLSEDSALH